MQVHVRMAPRDPHEPHRVSTPLELFLDLAFVVAVAQAASSLHHGLVEGHVSDALVGFPAVFFAIWWAWMNFAWFASAFDCDDVLYRLAVFAQMTGVLVLAAGVPRAFDTQDFGIMTLGYVIMRMAMVSQWLRVAVSFDGGRRTALRFVVGITVLQAGWLLRLALPEGPAMVAFAVLVVAELTVPIWAERAGRTPWHPHHMAERYGLFTIIVLGESVLSATLAVQGALDADRSVRDLLAVIAGGLLIVFSMWWIYFELPTERIVERARDEDDTALPFAWGYGHYFVFASVAATGGGIAVAVDDVGGDSTLSQLGTGLAVTIPVAIYLLAVWLLNRRAKPPGPMRTVVPLLGVALVLAVSPSRQPVLLTGIILAALVATGVVLGHSTAADPDEPVLAERREGAETTDSTPRSLR